MIYSLGDKRLTTDGDDFWIADNAIVIGDVVLKKNASIWYNCVIRGDNDPITIGENSQVQDGCVLHADPGIPCTLGDNVSIGHMVMLHGCEIGANTLIGIGAVILNKAKIGSNCVIGANSFIPPGKEIPDNSVVFGSPGKVVKEATDEHRAMIARTSSNYAKRWRNYQKELKLEG